MPSPLNWSQSTPLRFTSTSSSLLGAGVAALWKVPCKLVPLLGTCMTGSIRMQFLQRQTGPLLLHWSFTAHQARLCTPGCTTTKRVKIQGVPSLEGLQLRVPPELHRQSRVWRLDCTTGCKNQHDTKQYQHACAVEELKQQCTGRTTPGGMLVA